MSDQILSIPIGPHLKDNQVDYIIKSLNEFVPELVNKVAIAFMADYGRTHGKGLEVEAISSECKNLNILGDVYLRRRSAQDLAFTYHHQISVLPFGSLIFRLLTAIQSKIFKSFRSRYWQEKIFDLLVSMLLKNDSEMKVFYGVPRLVKSFKKAKTLGYTTVLHAAEMSSIHNIRLLESFTEVISPSNMGLFIARDLSQNI